MQMIIDGRLFTRPETGNHARAFKADHRGKVNPPIIQKFKDDTLSKAVLTPHPLIIHLPPYFTMKANYKFQNLCGTVYRQGNVIFTPDGNSVLSPVGNRVSVFDLVKLVLPSTSFRR